ncbi:MAG TPA: penicillin-binding protein 2 [Candidatus Jorgensenbacteria bacterium]|nr:penicillin-binding protein 2 [Candidatus Jorgensenbacteria bacterium]
MGFRFFILSSIFFLLYGVLGVNLYQLQVEQGDYYIKKVRARTAYQEELSLRRGQIFFTDRYKNSIPVALNKDYPIIYAVPKGMNDPDTVAAAIAPIVEHNIERLRELFSDDSRLFVPLAEKAREEQIASITELKLSGIYINNKQHRFYPFKKLAAQVIGFVGINESFDEPTGLYGLEKLYNEDLTKGEDIYLTLDRTLQAESEKMLRELVERFDASGGSIIIQNPQTGAILTMANHPVFDPNEYGAYPLNAFINPVVQYVYEAGSVFKPLTMSIGIDTGVLTPNTTYVDAGSVTLNGKTITNWDSKAYGKVTMTRVIERSINTGAVFAVQQINRKPFIRYLKKFGFGSRTDIALPDEVLGSLANLERKYARDIDFATAAFGQGTAVTPLQLITAYGVLANGGVLMRPYLNEAEGSYVVRRVLDRESAEQVTQMMESAVEKAVVAAIPGYRIAGKTGTAQVPDFERGGYSDTYIHTFVGFAPVSNPQFIILIKLDKPGASLAGQTVVPAFRNLAQFTLNYYGIHPDNLPEVSIE